MSANDDQSNDWIFECSECQERSWEEGTPLLISDLTDLYPQLVDHEDVLVELIVIEYRLRTSAGESASTQEFAAGFADLEPQILRALDAAEGVARDDSASGNFPYELLDVIGKGTCGTVHRAFDQRMHRHVALKWIDRSLRAESSRAEAVFREAKLAARVQHPGVVQVFDTGIHKGRPFLVMQLIEGSSLDCRILPGGMAIDETLTIVEKVSRAVGSAHIAGVTHRDLKPQNILVDESGQPFVTDFGIAKLFDETDGDTQSQQIFGTPRYASPEQLRGEPERNRPPSDVYSIGVILYELLTGTPPFVEESNAKLIENVLNVEPRPARAFRSGVPGDLATVCHKCLEKLPGDRYADGNELADELERVQEKKPIQGKPISWLGRKQRWLAREPVLATVLSLFVVSVVIGLLFSIRFALQAHDAEEEAVSAAAFAESQQYRLIIDSADAAIRSGRAKDASETLKKAPLGERNWEFARLQLEAAQLPWLKRFYDEHDWGITALAASHEHDLLATAAADGRVLLWSLSTGRLLRTLVEGEQSESGDRWLHVCDSPEAGECRECVTGLCWLAEKQLMMGTSKGRLVQVDLESGQSFERATHTAPIHCISRNRDSEAVIVGTGDGAILLYSLHDESTAVIFEGQSAITAIASAKSSVVCGDKSGRVVLIDLRNKKQTAYRVAGSVKAVDLAHDANGLLASVGGQGRSIHLLREHDGEFVLAGTLQMPPVKGKPDARSIEAVHFDAGVDCVFAVDNRGFLARLSRHSREAEWIAYVLRADVPSRQPLSADSRTGRIGIEQFCAGIIRGADSAELIVGGADYTARAWAIPKSRGPKHISIGPGPRLAAMSDSLIAVTSSDGQISVIDLNSKQVVDSTEAHSPGVTLVDSNGTSITTAASDGTVRFWRFEKGRLERARTITIPAGAVALDLSPDGSLVAAVDSRSTLRVWTVANGQVVHESLIGTAGTVDHAAVAFSPDGSMLAATGADETLHLLDARNWKRLPVTGRTGGAGALAMMWAGPNLLMLSNSSCEYERLNTVGSAWPTDVLFPGRPSSNCVGLSQTDDRRRWFFLEEDGRLVVFDPTSHGPILTREAGRTEAVDLAVTSSGTVAAAFEDGSICVWDVATPPEQTRSPAESVFSKLELAVGHTPALVPLERCVALDDRDKVLLLHLNVDDRALKEAGADLHFVREHDASSQILSNQVATTPPAFALAAHGSDASVLFRERIDVAGKHRGRVVLVTHAGTSRERRETVQSDGNGGFYPHLRMSEGTVNEIASFTFNEYRLERSFRAGRGWETEPLGRQGDGFNLKGMHAGDGWRLAFRTNRFNSDQRAPRVLTRTKGRWIRATPSTSATHCVAVLSGAENQPVLVMKRQSQGGKQEHFLCCAVDDGQWAEQPLPFDGTFIPESFANRQSTVFGCGINSHHQLCLLKFDGNLSVTPLIDIADDLQMSAVTRIDSQRRPVVVINEYCEGEFRISVLRGLKN